MSMIGTYRLFNAMENATVTSGTLQTLLTTSLQADSEFQAGVVQYGIFERAVASTNIMTAIVGSDAAITYLTSAVEAVPSLQLFVGSTTAMTAASTVTYARNAILGSGALSYIMSTGSVVRNANLSGFAQYIAPYYVWTSRTSGTVSAVTALTYGNGIYLRGAGDGVFRSFDAVTWTSAGLTGATPALLYVNNLFLASSGGVIATSPDATSWTTRVTGVNALTYGALYVGAGAAGLIATSTNGISWSTPTSGTTSNLNATAFGANRYVVAGDGGAMRVSTDGTTWQGVGPGAISPSAATIGADGSQWVAGIGGALAFTTTDNLFSTVSSGTTSSIRSIVYAAGQTQQYVYSIAGASNQIGTSTNGISWTLRTITSTNQTYYLSYGAGEAAPYFSVNQNGGVYSSTDAISWVTRTASGSGFVTTTYGGGRFYAAGSSGASIASSDGVVLETISPGFDQYGLISDGSLLVSGGSNGAVKTSTDGVAWTTRTSNTTSLVTAGVFAADQANRYVFILQPGGALTSTDGITWAQRNIGLGTLTFAQDNAGQGIAYGDGRFIIAGFRNSDSAGQVYSSTDGAAWSGPNVQIAGVQFLGAAASGLGTSFQQYAVCGTNGNIVTSTNASTWASRTTNTTSRLTGLAYGAGKYVAVGNGGTTLRTSSDGITWASPWILSNSDTIYAGVGGADGSVVVGSLTSSRIYFAADGVQWATRTSSTTSQGASLAYAPGQTQRFVMGAAGGALSTSTDGLTWTARTSGTTSYIGAIAYNSAVTEKYALATLSGGLRTSTDAITWTARTSGTTSNINALAASPTLTEKYVYAGDGGMVRTSTDGITWTVRTSGTTSIIRAATFADNIYVYAGAGGVLRTSTDGITWDARTSNTTSEIRSITYGGGLYCYVGAAGTIGTSTDGVTWTRRYSPTTTDLNTVFHSGTRFAAAGNSGLTAYSTNGVDWVVYNPSLTNTIVPFHNIAFINNMFVAGAATSTDGLHWDSNSIVQSSGQLAYANSAYWMVSNNPVGSSVGLQTSTDARAWQYTSGGLNTASSVTSIAFTTGPSPLIYGGDSGIRVSSTGLFWEGGGWSTSPGTTINDMVFAGGRYICSYSTNSMGYSEDGQSWRPLAVSTGSSGNLGSIATSIGQPGTPANGAFQYLVKQTNGGLWGFSNGLLGSAQSVTDPISTNNGSVAYGDGQYALVSRFNSSIAFSSSGRSSSWVVRTLPSGVTNTNAPNLLVHAPGQTVRWVVAGGSSVCTSTDTFTWSTVSIGSTVTAVKYFGDAPTQKYLSGSSGGQISTSTDGVTWTARTSGTTSTIFGFAYGNGRYVAYFANVQSLQTSTDAITWENTTPQASVNTVVFDGTKFVANGSGTVQTSTDGVDWITANGVTITSATGFAYGAGVYVASSSSTNAIFSSTDGKSWATRTAGTASTLNTVIYSSSDARFYAYGNNVQLSSTDGITWSALVGTTGMSGTTSTIRALIYANNTYVYAGDGGVIRTSTDGLNWTARTSGTSSILRSLAFSNGVFLTAGDGGVLRSSTDAITWDAQSSGTTSAINALTYGLGTSIFGGAGGVLGTNT